MSLSQTIETLTKENVLIYPAMEVGGLQKPEIERPKHACHLTLTGCVHESFTMEERHSCTTQHRMPCASALGPQQSDLSERNPPAP